MRFILLVLVFWGTNVSAEAPYKVVSCPRFPDGSGIVDKGTLTDGAWRIEEFIFNPKDFERDEPNLTHEFTVGYINKDGEPVESGQRYSPIRYRVSPTNLVFYHPWQETTYTIDRTALTVQYDTTLRSIGILTLTCSIRDLEAPQNRAF